MVLFLMIGPLLVGLVGGLIGSIIAAVNLVHEIHRPDEGKKRHSLKTTVVAALLGCVQFVSIRSMGDHQRYRASRKGTPRLR